jgi:hypothetical protein
MYPAIILWKEDRSEMRMEQSGDARYADICVQQFHTKSALMVCGSRAQLPPAYSKTGEKRQNRWVSTVDFFLSPMVREIGAVAQNLLMRQEEKRMGMRHPNLRVRHYTVPLDPLFDGCGSGKQIMQPYFWDGLTAMPKSPAGADGGSDGVLMVDACWGTKMVFVVSPAVCLTFFARFEWSNWCQ